jgi:hypothetical protein
MDQVDASFRSADATYDKDIGHAKDLLMARVDAVKHMVTIAKQVEEIDRQCNVLLSNTPAPEIGQHHAEPAVIGPVQQPTPTGPLPSDAGIAIISYKADVELAHKRWLDATAPARESAWKILTDELARAVQGGDDLLVGRLKPMVARLDEAQRGIPTTWYRETLTADASGTLPPRVCPVALAVHGVYASDPVFGLQYKGGFAVRTLVEPYKHNPKVAGPGYTLLIYDGDKIVFCTAGGWGGDFDVGGEMSLGWDTRRNGLLASRNQPFVFTKGGTFSMRLIVVNNGVWNDVLDVYAKEFVVP